MSCMSVKESLNALQNATSISVFKENADEFISTDKELFLQKLLSLASNTKVSNVS